MKKYLIFKIIGIVSIIFLTSCNKEELTPTFETGVSDLSAFDSRVRIEGQVRAIYASLKNSGMYGGRYQIFNDIRGGDFSNERTNVVTGFDVWSYTTINSSTNSVVNHWAQAYYVINLVNIFVDGMSSKGTSVVGASLANNFLAEARLVRALSYYSLLQLYARPFWDGNGAKPGVPLRLKGIVGSGDHSLARATVAEVYNQILTDLSFAEQNLPTTNSTAVLNTTRAHRNTAIALKTRVYLSMNNYDKVIEEANKIVSTSSPFVASSGVPHSLNASFTNIFTSYTSPESILSMPFASNETPGTQNQFGYYYGAAFLNGGNGDYSLNASGIISNTNWRSNDTRRSQIRTTNTLGDRAGTDKSWLMKFPSAAPYTDYAPVIRYAEVLLNLAEALARKSSSPDPRAVAILNAVRMRSDATFTPFAPLTGTELTDLILTERRIELLGEGFAGSDLTRLGLPLPAKPGLAAIPSSSRSYIWPISANELILNPLCIDNN